MGKRKTRLQKTAVVRVPAMIGVAWYSLAQWARLREVAADPEELDQTYEAWLSTYERTTRDLTAQGMVLRKVPVDVAELEKWCRERKKQIDGRARSEYVSEIVRRAHAMLDVISADESAMQ